MFKKTADLAEVGSPYAQCAQYAQDALCNVHSVHIQSVHTLVIHTLHAVNTLVMHSVRSGRTGYAQCAHAVYAPD